MAQGHRYRLAGCRGLGQSDTKTILDSVFNDRCVAIGIGNHQTRLIIVMNLYFQIRHEEVIEFCQFGSIAIDQIVRILTLDDQAMIDNHRL